MVARAGCHIAVGTAVDVDGLRIASLSELMGPGSDVKLPPPHPDHQAYAMFTSGSTGQPKGMLMGQAPLLNLTARLRLWGHVPQRRPGDQRRGRRAGLPRSRRYAGQDSLRLHDGPTMRLGLELSISTGRLHVRGPVGL
jgi:acyl-CoA synthetase (AMP-forming)/AMP-acid ligase II